MNLLLVEIRRALRRRVIRVMVLLALAWCAVAGVIAFISSDGRSIAELRAGEGGHPALLTDWWVPGQDSAVLTAGVFLLIGGFFAGAAVAGAEWRAGTVTTVLTWEPRRTRLTLTRTAACALSAFAIAMVLQAAFLAAFLPAVLAHGSTAGATSGWWASLLLAVLRIGLLTAFAAVVGVALATIGRNTAFALAVVFGWMAVAEGIVRGLRPGWSEYLWAENIGTIVPWSQLEGAEFSRGPLVALVSLVAYTGALVAIATVLFRRRDLAGAT
jgi:ABC-type transport system involved in multi-copper enzyme maturation permease subunit